MKKTYLLNCLLTLFLLLGGTLSAYATEPSTLQILGTAANDNEKLPIYSYNAGGCWFHSQILYPPTLVEEKKTLFNLSELDGKKLTALTFNAKSTSQSWGTGTFTVSLKQLDNVTALTSYVDITGATTVYEGTLSVSSSELTITFSSSANFVYDKTKYLLLDIQTKTKGSYGSHLYFWGKNTDGSYSLSGYTTSNTGVSGITSPAACYFIPRTKFTYEDVSSGGSSCDAPTDLAVPAANITVNGARVTWDKGEATSTTLEYKLHSASSWTLKSATATSPCNLINLAANSTYDVRIKNVCAESESDWVSISFDTHCEAESVPYAYGFEDVVTGSEVYNMPDCWAYVRGLSTNWYMFVENNSSNAKTGNKYLNVYCNRNTTEKAQLIILPEMAQEIKNLSLSLAYKTAGGNSTEDLQVGYVTNPKNAGTFVATSGTSADRKLPVSNSTYSSEDITFAGAPDGARIAIRLLSTADYYGARVYIDDINVAVASSCKKPASLSATATSANGIKLTWTAKGEETAWQVQYKSTGSWSSPVAASTNPFTLTGLAAETTYEIQVRANCGGEQSAWSTSATEQTLCAAVSADGWSENFENVTAGSGNLPNCWRGEQYVGPSATYPYVYSSNYYAHNSSKCLYFYGGVTGTSDQIAILPLFTEDLNTLDMTFFHKDGSTSSSYGYLELGFYKDGVFTAKKTLVPRSSSYPENAETWEIAGATSGDRIAIRYTGGLSSYYACIDDITLAKRPTCFAPKNLSMTGSTYNSATFSWDASGKGESQYQYACIGATATLQESDWSAAFSGTSKTADNLATGTSYKFYVRSYCSSSDKSSAIASDAFAPTCNAPSDVTATTTNNSATINWTANNGEDTWNIQYRQGTTGDWTTISATKTKPYTISPLTASTNYQVQVMSASGCNSSYSSPISFKTKCDPITITQKSTYFNNFESETVNTIPACWDKISSNNYPYVVSGTAAYGESGKCLCFYTNATETAIMPKFANALQSLTVSFYYRHSNSDLQIGYVKADGKTFVSVATLPTRSAYATKPYDVDMSEWSSEAVYIAFRMTNTTSSYSNAYIDNVKVEITPTCFVPQNLAKSAVTSSGATLSWAASTKANETQYQYICVPKGDTPDWDSEDAHLTNNTSVTLSDREPNTSYDFYVRSYCSSTYQSEAVTVDFTTICGTMPAASLPWDYDFEDATNGSMPGCWKAYYASDYHAYVWTSNVHRGSKALDIIASKNTGSETVVVLPKFDINLNTLAVSFYYRGSNGTIQVGYVTNEDDKTTFQAVGEAITPITSYQMAAVSFASLAAGKYNIALRFKGNTGDGSFNLDDVRVAETQLFADGTDGFETRLSGLTDVQTDVLMTRPLQFDGYYSTLCLPFDLSAEQLADADCPLYNFTIKYFDYVEIQNGEMIVSIAPTSAMTAGMPYFVMYNGSTTAKPLLFRDVTITAAAPSEKESAGVRFIGTFNHVGLAAQTADQNHDIIYLGRGNQLYWPDQAVTVKGFRGYMSAQTGSAQGASPVRKGMNIRFGESQPTPTNVELNAEGTNGEWTKVLRDGHIYILRDGKCYSIMGQVIE